MRLTFPRLAAAAAALALTAPAAASAQQHALIGPGSKMPFFGSYSQLTDADQNDSWDMFTLVDGQTRLVTGGAGGANAFVVGASEDASVVFFSTYGQVLPGDTDDTMDLYVRTPAGVAFTGIGPDYEVTAVTPDGAYAFLESASQLLPSDTDETTDVYRYETASGDLHLASPGASVPVRFVGAMDGGDTVLLQTAAKLSADDTDLSADVFRFDGQDHVRLTPGNTTGDTTAKAAAPNGRVIVATSEKMCGNDTDGTRDLFAVGTGGCVLLTPSPNGPASAAETVFLGAAQADAGRVVFQTTEQLLPSDMDTQVDLYASVNGTLTLITPGPGNAILHDVSDDATAVLFASDGQKAGTDDDFVYDLYRSTPAGLFHVLPTNAPFEQFEGRLSPDGALVAFETAEPIDSADQDTAVDVYLRAGSMTLMASRRQDDSAPGGPASYLEIKEFLASGQILFAADERLTGDDTDDDIDTYRFDGFELERLSREQNPPDATLAGPAVATDADVLTYAVGADEPGAVLECRVDGFHWDDCPASWEVGKLPAGDHLVEARATDALGNVDETPAAITVTVTPWQPGQEAVDLPVEKPQTAQTTQAAADTTAPVLSAAKVRVRKRRATLSYRLSEAATVKVLIQRRAGRRWRKVRTISIAAPAGASRRTLGRVPRGKVRFVLTAADAAGNAAARLTVR